MTLAAQFDPRHNAITFLRLLLSLLVVYGHAYELGQYRSDPLQRTFGVTCGELGVNIFFALSGFLVTRSYLQSPSVKNYFFKRATRIFPGFWVCLLVTALMLAPALSSWRGQGNFFSSAASANSLNYVLQNAALKINRPGIGPLFIHNPAAGIINGSLWSLFPEALCYAGVIVLGSLGLFAKGKNAAIVVLLFVTAPLHAWLVSHQNQFEGHAWIAIRYSIQACFFAAGTSAWVLADRLAISKMRCATATVIFAVLSFFFGYGWGATILVTYIALGGALYFPRDALDKIGDWSYGVYIYHYPVFQTLWFLGARPRSAEIFFLWALPFTAILAVLSWRYIEAPALRWKTRSRSPLAPPST